MKVIDSNKLERDAGGKPVPAFLVPRASATTVATITGTTTAGAGDVIDDGRATVSATAIDVLTSRGRSPI